MLDASTTGRGSTPSRASIRRSQDSAQRSTVARAAPARISRLYSGWVVPGLRNGTVK